MFYRSLNEMIFLNKKTIIVLNGEKVRYIKPNSSFIFIALSALTLLVGRQEGIRPEWWGAGVVIFLERGADLHMAQLMPLTLTVSCFGKIQDWFYLSGTG